MNFVGTAGRVGWQVTAWTTPPVPADPSSGKGPEWGKAAPIGLLVIVLLCVAVYFLIKSLNRNMKKVPESFESPEAESVPVGADEVPAMRAHGRSGRAPGAAGTSDRADRRQAGPGDAGSSAPAK